jgi:hypothetical protein
MRDSSSIDPPADSGDLGAGYPVQHSTSFVPALLNGNPHRRLPSSAREASRSVAAHTFQSIDTSFPGPGVFDAVRIKLPSRLT